MKRCDELSEFSGELFGNLDELVEGFVCDEKREIMDRLKKRATELSEGKDIVFGGVLVDAVEKEHRELKSDGFNSDRKELIETKRKNLKMRKVQKEVVELAKKADNFYF